MYALLKEKVLRGEDRNGNFDSELEGIFTTKEEGFKHLREGDNPNMLVYMLDNMFYSDEDMMCPAYDKLNGQLYVTYGEAWEVYNGE